MANYPGATPPFPSLTEIQNEFNNQAESEKFQDETTIFCRRENTNIHELVGITIGYLHGRTPPGIEDLAEFMRALIGIYHLNYLPDSPELYEAIKGIPAHSAGRIGYTFQRRRSGTERGVFVFLR